MTAYKKDPVKKIAPKFQKKPAAKKDAAPKAKDKSMVRNPTGSKGTGRGHKYTSPKGSQREQAVAIRKESILLAFKKNYCNVSRACEDAGISRQTWGNYMREDPEFRQKVNDIIEGLKDLVESHLIKSIVGGDVTAQIFFLKTRCKDRGYVERQEIVTANVIQVGFMPEETTESVNQLVTNGQK